MVEEFLDSDARKEVLAGIGEVVRTAAEIDSWLVQIGRIIDPVAFEDFDALISNARSKWETQLLNSIDAFWEKHGLPETAFRLRSATNRVREFIPFRDVLAHGVMRVTQDHPESNSWDQLWSAKRREYVTVSVPEVERFKNLGRQILDDLGWAFTILGNFSFPEISDFSGLQLVARMPENNIIRLRYIWGETESEFASLYLTKINYRDEYQAPRLAELPTLVAKLRELGLIVDASTALKPYLQGEESNEEPILG